MSYHIAVMLNECVEALNINPNGIYVDLTYGGGGHTRIQTRYKTISKAIIFS